MPSLRLSKQAATFLKKIPLKHAKQISDKLEDLEKNVHPHDSKSLKGYPYFRVDSGEYRIVYRYTAENDITIVLLIGKRNDNEVYKKLRRYTS